MLYLKISHILNFCHKIYMSSLVYYLCSESMPASLSGDRDLAGECSERVGDPLCMTGDKLVNG